MTNVLEPKYARDIKVGDTLTVNGKLIYTVEEIVDVVPSHVRARVRYIDGGDGLRAWQPNDDVPLTRTANSTGPTANEWVRP